MQTHMSELNRNQIIASTAGTLQVLELLGRGGTPMSLAEIVAATGRPKGTAHRMVSTLVNTGFAHQAPETRRYSLTLKAWRIGSSAVHNLDLVERARPLMDRLQADTGETVHVAVLDPSGAVVYVAKVESPRSIGVQTRLGQLSPSWCTATGRSMLAFDERAAARVLSAKLERRTPKTVTDPRKLREILAQVRKNGYAVTCAENHPEMGGVAAPVRDHTGGVVAAVGVAMPEYRMNPAMVKASIPLVRETAAAVSSAIGHTESTKERFSSAA